MNTLVLKNNQITGGNDKLYRDALVSKGTLFSFDFSNKGCIQQNNLSTVSDLATESKEDLGIDNEVSFQTTDLGVVPILTSRFGYPFLNLGSYNFNSFDSGLNIFNIDNYLFEKQPENTLLVVWASVNPDVTNPYIGVVGKSGDTSEENIRLVSGASSLSIRNGGIGFNNYPLSNTPIQLCVERLGVGQPVRLYINGKFYQNGQNGYSYKAGTANPISLGVKQPGRDSNIVVYRTFMEDLNESGRSSVDVVAKDYSYVNAINEYLGIEKRPFANL